MKKLFLFLTACIVSVCAAAQFNQVVWQNGRIMYGHPISCIDSILYDMSGTLDGDTLHLILPRTTHDTVYIHDTVYQSSGTPVDPPQPIDTIFEYPEVPLDPSQPLSGWFSISRSKYVRFSSGNLQYTRSTDTWSFATHQYDFLAPDTGNVQTDTLDDKIDLFGWSGSTATAKWGVGIATDPDDYSGDFTDWGANIGDGNTWRTLTRDEWVYLFASRPSDLVGIACIRINRNKFINGLIILPDAWYCPAGITFKSGFGISKYPHTAEDYAEYQTFTLGEWQRLEAAGAVFLPASGLRSATEYLNVNIGGDYWTATFKDETDCWCWEVTNSYTNVAYTRRSNGRAVRLVQEVNF